MMDMTAEKLQAMGGKVELVDIGVQEVSFLKCGQLNDYVTGSFCLLLA